MVLLVILSPSAVASHRYKVSDLQELFEKVSRLDTGTLRELILRCILDKDLHWVDVGLIIASYLNPITKIINDAFSDSFQSSHERI